MSSYGRNSSTPTPPPPPPPPPNDPPSGFWRYAAAAVGVAAGALVASGLWNQANSAEPETVAEKKKGKTMKAPGRDHKIYRDDFASDPKAYFREDRERRKHGL